AASPPDKPASSSVSDSRQLGSSAGADVTSCGASLFGLLRCCERRATAAQPDAEVHPPLWTSETGVLPSARTLPWRGREARERRAPPYGWRRLIPGGPSGKSST